jgi:hypothetical protein
MAAGSNPIHNVVFFLSSSPRLVNLRRQYGYRLARSSVDLGRDHSPPTPTFEEGTLQLSSRRKEYSLMFTHKLEDYVSVCPSLLKHLAPPKISSLLSFFSLA